MFYRRKIILAILQLFDGQLEKIRLQKLLFLLAERQEKSDYNFIPYRFGCYSFSVNADLSTMVTKGFLGADEKHFDKIDNADYIKQLKPDDQKLLLELKNNYGKLSTNALIKHTYLNYPFYAIKSEVAKDILSTSEMQKVNDAMPKCDTTILFTIGYEGISLEEYLVRLLKNGVKVLGDVRNNPLSMKFGFSKSQLIKYCESIGIQYLHFPELGIQSELRQELNSQSDYDKLFSAYRKITLSKTANTQIKILNLLKQNKRIALTCFEANICQCHRKHLAEAIASLPDFLYEVKHI